MTQLAYPRLRAPRIDVAGVLAGGVFAGLIGGVAMALFLMLDLEGLRQGSLSIFAAMAATFLGPRALVAGGGAVILGVMIHIAFSVGFGVLFSLAVPRRTTGGPALAYGLFAAGIILVFMTFAILPWADPTLGARVVWFQLSWLFAHVLYGIGLAFAPVLRRAFASL